MGDYHLGRSCRLRQNPPPSQFGGDEAVGSSEEDPEGMTWEEAWQEVWQTQEGSDFVPPLFPQNGQLDKMAESDQIICTLPPESRYIQIIHQLTKAFTHSTVVVKQLDKLKSVTNTIVVSGKHHGENMRQKACDIVKKKIEERAKIRNQPVVLTRHGATWIRRVCGTGDGNVVREDDDQIIDESRDAVVDDDENGTNETTNNDSS
jgi:hypothetical protein